MEKAPTKPHWTTADMLRRTLLVRCAAYCEKTGTASSILSTHVAGAAKWIKGIEEGADMKLATYDRAMRRLDQLEAMTPWPRLRIDTRPAAATKIVMEQIVIRKEEERNGRQVKKIACSKQSRRGRNKSNRGKSGAIRRADRKLNGRPRQRARGIHGTLPANS